jgi:hypothetical protein
VDHAGSAWTAALLPLLAFSLSHRLYTPSFVLNYCTIRPNMLWCDQIAINFFEVAQSLTHKGVIAHEAEMVTAALTQKPDVRPFGTKVFSAWPAAT